MALQSQLLAASGGIQMRAVLSPLTLAKVFPSCLIDIPQTGPEFALIVEMTRDAARLQSRNLQRREQCMSSDGIRPSDSLGNLCNLCRWVYTTLTFLREDSTASRSQIFQPDPDC